MQGEGNEEGCWMLHNAMRDPQGVAYHPECFKDKEAQENLSLQAVQTKVSHTLYTFPMLDTIEVIEKISSELHYVTRKIGEY